MRNPDRIEPFLKEVGEIWKTHFSDWRFGQLICNMPFNRDPFFMEEDEFLEVLKSMSSPLVKTDAKD